MPPEETTDLEPF